MITGHDEKKTTLSVFYSTTLKRKRQETPRITGLSKFSNKKLPKSNPKPPPRERVRKRDKAYTWEWWSLQDGHRHSRNVQKSIPKHNPKPLTLSVTHRHGTERVTAIRSVARRGPYAPKPVSHVVCAQEGPKNVDAGARLLGMRTWLTRPSPNILAECLVFLCIKVAITTNIMQICTKMYGFLKSKYPYFLRVIPLDSRAWRGDVPTPSTGGMHPSGQDTDRLLVPPMLNTNRCP